MIDVQVAQQTAKFTGALTRATISRSFDKKYRTLANQAALTLDLANVTQVDSAGLAWILQLTEMSTNSGCVLNITNLPDDLIKLAKLSAVDVMLPIEKI